jgi:hypothetical protein
VRKPLTHTLVRLARGPAHAAGLGHLQEFLERGLVAFESMHGAREFLDLVRDREQHALEELFAGEVGAGAATRTRVTRGQNRSERSSEACAAASAACAGAGRPAAAGARTRHHRPIRI